MGTGEIITAIVTGLVLIGIVAMVVAARRKRRQADANQTHSNVKPHNTHDRTDLIQNGGLGTGGHDWAA